MRGARWVQSEILEASPDAPVRVYAVYFEMVAADEGARARVRPDELLNDPRVVSFWDEDKLVGRWYDENVTKLGEQEKVPDRIEWDSFFVYGPSAEWGEKPPRVRVWGRPLHRERERLKRGLERALARVGG